MFSNPSLKKNDMMNLVLRTCDLGDGNMAPEGEEEKIVGSSEILIY